MLKTFNSTREFGPMSERKKYYDKEMNILEIEKDLLKRRIELGKKYGFDGTKILVPSTNNSYKYGKTVDVTKLVTEVLNDAPDYDLWDIDIPCDIMLIKKKGITLASPVADCAVIVASTKDTFGIANCTAVDIDRELPTILVEEVQKLSKEKASNIEVYVGPCAGTSYIYYNKPIWAKNPIWKKNINRVEDGCYSINMKKTILMELLATGVKKITMSPVDTITDPNYYSHYSTINGIENKPGRILCGAFMEDTKEKIKVK